MASTALLIQITSREEVSYTLASTSTGSKNAGRFSNVIFPLLTGGLVLSSYMIIRAHTGVIVSSEKKRAPEEQWANIEATPNGIGLVYHF